MSKEVCIDKDVAYHQTVIGAAKTVLIPSAQNAERVQSAIEGGATRHMYCSKLDLATLMLLTVLVVIVAVRFASYPSAVQSANSESFPPKPVTVVIRWFKFEPTTETVHSGDIME